MRDSNDIRRQLEAHDIRILRRERPVHDQLQFRIDRQYGERVLVHVCGARRQGALGWCRAVLEEELIAGGRSVDADEGQRNADDVRVNGCGQFFDVFFCRLI